MISVNNQYSWINEELEELKRTSLYRKLKTCQPLKGGKLKFEDRELINLCSNNYLGISEELNLNLVGSVDNVVVGATASRLIVGNHPSFNELEQSVAELKDTEAALVFSCGYMANLGLITSLVRKGDAVFSDRLNHASIVDGIRLSRAKHFRYRHNDPGHLKELLVKHQDFGRKLIITESLFSMDGDMARLRELVKLKDEHGAILVVDEAHGGGVYGANGAGLVNELELTNQVEIQMGTFSKAYGCYGAYIAGDSVVIDYLINKARTFIFTTGLPPVLNFLNQQALGLVIKDGWRRGRLAENAEIFRAGLKERGYDIGNSESHIIPLVIGDEKGAVKFREKLWERGIAVAAIRPPTVPRGASRLRFSISAMHKKSDLERVLDIIEETIRTPA